MGPQFDSPATARVWRGRTSYPERCSYPVELTFACTTFRESP